ncbi:ferrochelatase [Cognatiluteimonas weifangensis]|uniref:Ferrochelatase n=1 Tax=Cognatiluteimonas weifangensis TaxID=2303539 RepID=A0A372DHR4_9GAMM|nr:ferrochelatase [Luteimonas weifangensis]RFP59024.1 ferrochelatase [Luteimonas weifangensis]
MTDPSATDASAPDAAATALILANLGTPAAPTPRAVRRFLAQFLHDRRVVQLTRWLWCPLLHFLILPLRGPKVARKYAAIWLPEGSPLAVYTRALAAAVQQRLPQVQVLHAMRYGEPGLDAAFAQLRRQRVGRVLVLPLYPQYSTTTTASIADVVGRARSMPTALLPEYHEDPGWIAAIAGSIRAHWAAHGRGQHLLLSFHGIPQRLADAGDPYPQQCAASARAIAAALDLADDAWSLAYQSRFGRERWLQPATAERLDALAAAGVRTLDVACPGFATDCLETLEEVAMMLAERFAAAGGTLRYIPCLNAAPAHADALAALARRALAAD